MINIEYKLNSKNKYNLFDAIEFYDPKKIINNYGFFVSSLVPPEQYDF